MGDVTTAGNAGRSHAPQVRPAQLGDHEALVAFNQAMAMESEGRVLDGETLSAGVRRVLRDPREGFYRVALLGQQVVGALMVTEEWSDWRNGRFWWIQSVYVRPEARRRGVYRALYDHVREAARHEPEVLGFRLYVERDNAAARATYERLGMDESVYRLYEAPRD